VFDCWGDVAVAVALNRRVRLKLSKQSGVTERPNQHKYTADLARNTKLAQSISMEVKYYPDYKNHLET